MTSAISQNNQQSNTTNNIVSSSSLNVKRRPEINETVFRVNKGVKTFDFSFEKNLLITGGILLGFYFRKNFENKMILTRKEWIESFGYTIHMCHLDQLLI